MMLLILYFINQYTKAYQILMETALLKILFKVEVLIYFIK